MKMMLLFYLTSNFSQFTSQGMSSQMQSSYIPIFLYLLNSKQIINQLKNNQLLPIIVI